MIILATGTVAVDADGQQFELTGRYKTCYAGNTRFPGNKQAYFSLILGDPLERVKLWHLRPPRGPGVAWGRQRVTFVLITSLHVVLTSQYCRKWGESARTPS